MVIRRLNPVSGKSNRECQNETTALPKFAGVYTQGVRDTPQRSTGTFLNQIQFLPVRRKGWINNYSEVRSFLFTHLMENPFCREWPISLLSWSSEGWRLGPALTLKGSVPALPTPELWASHSPGSWEALGQCCAPCPPSCPPPSLPSPGHVSLSAEQDLFLAGNQDTC